ncbi:MAG: hypothetical protein K5921_02815 [Lachnospiraceae bacterium]|nr:hypothetical protein [Lachnospiraceae bacterium]
MSENKHNTLSIEYPEIALEWDYEKNSPMTPLDVTSFSNKKVWWKCNKKGHSYQRSIYSQVSNGNNCPICNGKLYVRGLNDIKTLFPDIADEWDYGANCDSHPEDYSYISRIEKFWICSSCGTKWKSQIKSRCVRGSGCPKCASKKRWEKRSMNMNLGITDSNLLLEWDYEHNEKGPECYTPQSNKTVYWICSECGYHYMAKICNRSNGRKCPCCQRRKVVQGINDLATTHPQLAKEWDYEKNFPLTPQQVLYGTRRKVFWKCSQGHSYKSSINHRSSLGRETNCPICFSGSQTSFAEQSVFYYVKKLFPDAISRYKDIFENGMELDIYIPSRHLAIEYDGEAWHRKDKRNREWKKLEICHKNNIRLIRLIEKADQAEEIAADESFSISDGPMYEPKHLEKVIRLLLDNLDHKHIHAPIDINISRDENNIRQYMTVITNSLANTHPNIASEWDFAANGGLTPDKVKAGSTVKVGWICSKCGYKYKSAIYSRTSKHPTGCPKCGIQKNAQKRSKAVDMIDLNTGKVLRTFASIRDASQEISINDSNITMVCKGIRAKAGGFGWKYHLNKGDMPNLPQDNK